MYSHNAQFPLFSGAAATALTCRATARGPPTLSQVGAALSLCSSATLGHRALASSREAARAEETDVAWITTPSGLQYRDVLEGEGDMPAKGQTVRVHYTGRLESNGKQLTIILSMKTPHEKSLLIEDNQL